MKIYASVCKNTIAQNRKLPIEKQKPPIRVSRGKYGKPFYRWRMTFQLIQQSSVTRSALHHGVLGCG